MAGSSLESEIEVKPRKWDVGGQETEIIKVGEEAQVSPSPAATRSPSPRSPQDQKRHDVGGAETDPQMQSQFA